MGHNQKSLNPSEKMMYLQSSVGGIARQLISGMLCDQSLYPVALQTPEERFAVKRTLFERSLTPYSITLPRP